MTLCYQKMKGNIIMEARDFCLGRFSEIGDDYATLLNISVKSASLPEIKGNTRAVQHVYINLIIYSMEECI